MLCWFFNCLLKYILFIDWFSTCLDLIIVSFHLNCCSTYVCGCFYKKWLLCMILSWLLSYITFIDSLFVCLDLFGGSLRLNDCSEYVCGHFYKKWFLCMFFFIIILFPVHWLILSLDRYVYRFFTFELSQAVYLWTIYKKWLLCLFEKWSVSYTKFMDWFFTCFDICVVSFHLKYCRWHDIVCFTRNDYFIWMWND